MKIISLFITNRNITTFIKNVIIYIISLIAYITSSIDMHKLRRFDKNLKETNYCAQICSRQYSLYAESLIYNKESVVRETEYSRKVNWLVQHVRLYHTFCYINRADMVWCWCLYIIFHLYVSQENRLVRHVVWLCHTFCYIDGADICYELLYFICMFAKKCIFNPSAAMRNRLCDHCIGKQTLVNIAK